MEKIHTDVRVERVHFGQLFSFKIHKRSLHKGKINSCIKDQVWDPRIVMI